MGTLLIPHVNFSEYCVKIEQRMSNGKKVGVVGSGLVGKSWAMIFASQGYQVVLFDIEQSQVTRAMNGIANDLQDFEKEGILRGNLSAKVQTDLISGCTKLEECVKDSVYIQECVPENLNLKIKVWTEIDNLVTSDKAILATSTSCILPSKICSTLKHREQFIVAHPVNPPYHAPMVELVPSEWTNEFTKTETRKIMSEVGQVPVSMSKELPGFILNRIQYAILNECWRLVADDIVSAEDLDVVMKDGLGLRYAVCGPMEVIHLNAEGLKKYCEVYGDTIYNVSTDFKGIPGAWKMDTADGVAEVEKPHDQMTDLYPMDKLDERRLRRDKILSNIAKIKRQINL